MKTRKEKSKERNILRKVTDFFGVSDRRSLVIFTLLTCLGIMWYAPLAMHFTGFSDYSIDFVMTDVSASESSGFVKESLDEDGFLMVLTRYSDVIRIAVVSDVSNVVCVMETEAGTETKLLKRLDGNRFFGELPDPGVFPVGVVCNGYSLTSSYVEGLKSSRNYVSGFAGFPVMIPY